MAYMSFVERWASEDGDQTLAEGVTTIGEALLRVFTKNRADLPIVLACAKHLVPALERHLLPHERDLYDHLSKCIAAIDLTAAVEGQQHD